MKTKNYLIATIALVFSACTTGSYVTSRYVDDIYFDPANIPPPVVLDEKPEKEAPAGEKSASRLIISEITDNEEGGKTMNNYVFDGRDAGSYADAQLYNLEQMELEGSDTTVYYDDNEIKYVINNYYNGDDIDFSRRIRMFHRPFFYDPFYFHSWYWDDPWYWDSWYYPYSSLAWGWGYSPWYSGWYGGFYGGWYSPWYSSWYSPYSYYGWGGWGYPWYAWGGSYYGNYWGGRYYDSENYRYVKRRDYQTTIAGGRDGFGSASAFGNERSSLKSTSPSGTSDHTLRRAGSISGAENGGRPDRQGNVSGSAGESRVVTEMRRNNVDATDARNRTSGGAVARNPRDTGNGTRQPGNNTAVTGNRIQSQPSATGRYSGTQMRYTRPATSQNSQGNSYSPSYNQPRSSNRSTYNIQGSARPSTSTENQTGQLKSGQRAATIYSRPSGNSGSDRTYRSGSTYNRSSSSGVNQNRSYSQPSGAGRSTYSAPSRSSSPSYSAPSHSSGSYSSGGGGGYSSGGSSGGGSHSSGGGSSHSGRR